MPLSKQKVPASWIWATSVVLAWVVVATSLGQPQQSSQDLVGFGAIKGEDFSVAQTWRLLASQWLHVKFLHMLFNALVIASVGQAAEARFGWRAALAVGLIGGTLAQLVTVYTLPNAFISGASQAYRLARRIGGPRRCSRWAARARTPRRAEADMVRAAVGAVNHGVCLAGQFVLKALVHQPADDGRACRARVDQ
ncbi:membrane hypothetical protein [Mesorhizobium escarrei]|uniref:Peptidase S54 rhomboid domain-containing protein n=1 Tax=Mesorhizobium escarrei TaxID=666018 RepID=A0ABN8KH74_9HYPH|nr:membrane hypothetical protein [Mesorhizobium escarrei]